MLIHLRLKLSHNLAIAELFPALLAAMTLVLRGIHTEGNEAASKRAAHKAQNEAQEPSQSTVVALNMGYSLILTVLADDADGDLGPATDWVV